MKPIVFGFVMAILIGCLCIGSVSAVESPTYEATGTQEIVATAKTYEASIRAPIEIGVDEWDLVRGGNNDKYVGSVTISSDAPTGWLMTLTTTAYMEEWLANENNPLEVTTEYAGDESTWSLLSTGGLTTDPPIELFQGSSPNDLSDETSVPIYLRQMVTDQEPDVYTLTMTYTLKVTNPGQS